MISLDAQGCDEDGADLVATDYADVEPSLSGQQSPTDGRPCLLADAASEPLPADDDEGNSLSSPVRQPHPEPCASHTTPTNSPITTTAAIAPSPLRSPVSLPWQTQPSLGSPHPNVASTSRRESRASRALLAAAAACRRLSEVGLVNGLSAVTSAAASWVMPAAARRRVSTGVWPPDPEAALPTRARALQCSLTAPQVSVSSAAPPIPPAAYRASVPNAPRDLTTHMATGVGSPANGGGGGSATRAASVSAGSSGILGAAARLYGSLSTASGSPGPQRPLAPRAQGTNATAAAAAAEAPASPGCAPPRGPQLESSPRPPAADPSGVSPAWPRFSPPRGLAPPPPLPPGTRTGSSPFPSVAASGPSLAAAGSPCSGSEATTPLAGAPGSGDDVDAATAAGVFRPRATPSDGLLFLAPSARSSMWSPTRGTRWSLDQYELSRKLYKGYASTVYKATCLTSHTDVILKVYSLDSLTDFLRHQVLRELDIHSRLRHPGIVQLLAAFREGNLLVLVMEYVRGGSLDQARRKLGGRMNEQWALHLVLQPLLRVLVSMHRQGVVHRDVKPENILFTPDWRLKLCDFGVSIQLAEERAVTRAGSSDYMAPEVNACPLKATAADNKVNDKLAYGAAADVWSLGTVLYELLVGFTPFPGGPPPQAAAARASAAGESGGSRSGGGVSLAYPASVSAGARGFIGRCLEPHPGDRPTVEQLLQDSWLLAAQQAPPADGLPGVSTPPPCEGRTLKPRDIPSAALPPNSTSPDQQHPRQQQQQQRGPEISAAS